MKMQGGYQFSVTSQTFPSWLIKLYLPTENANTISGFNLSVIKHSIINVLFFFLDLIAHCTTCGIDQQQEECVQFCWLMRKCYKKALNQKASTLQL